MRERVDGTIVISGPIQVLNLSYSEADFPDTFRTATSIRNEIAERGGRALDRDLPGGQHRLLQEAEQKEVMKRRLMPRETLSCSTSGLPGTGALLGLTNFDFDLQRCNNPCENPTITAMGGLAAGSFAP